MTRPIETGTTYIAYCTNIGIALALIYEGAATSAGNSATQCHELGLESVKAVGANLDFIEWLATGLRDDARRARGLPVADEQDGGTT